MYLLQALVALAKGNVAIRTTQRPLRSHLLPSCHLQFGEPHALRKCQGTDEEYCRSGKGD